MTERNRDKSTNIIGYFKYFTLSLTDRTSRKKICNNVE